MTGINQVLKICWGIVNNSRNINNDNGHIVTYKMDLTTNVVVITDAIKFVQTNKEKLTTMSSKEEDKLE
jgi:hypothetical protein